MTPRRFTRGYAPTDPAPDGDYSGRALGRDAIELADALGTEFGTDDVVLIGHDWGAVAAYAAGWDAPDARINDVKETFRAEGTVENALQYYRDTMRPPVPRLGDAPPSLEDVPPIETPTLVLCGARDGCIAPELFEHADEVLADCRIVRVPNAGHFMHQERPEAVCDEITAFL